MLKNRVRYGRIATKGWWLQRQLMRRSQPFRLFIDDQPTRPQAGDEITWSHANEEFSFAREGATLTINQSRDNHGMEGLRDPRNGVELLLFGLGSSLCYTHQQGERYDIFTLVEETSSE